MIELSVVRDLVAIFSVIIALGYYIINIRHQRETRQAQLFNSIYQSLNEKELFNIPWELEIDWEYTDYDDFMSKYGPEADRDAYMRFHRLFAYYEGMGIYVKRGLVSAGLIDDFISGDIIEIWEKYEPIMSEIRVRDNAPAAFEHFEYLYDKIKPIRDLQHPELAT